MNLRRLQDLSLKWKLVIPFLFLAAMGATSLFVVSYRFQDSLIHVNEANRLRNQYQFFLNDIEFKKNMAMSLAYLVAKNPDVAEAFARRDRKRLTELLYPAYQTLHKDFGVKQFHFHVPPATSFLRLHALHQYGAKMEAYRHTINKARETGTGVGGIESGVFGLGIRSVVPVFHAGKQVGTVEIGLSLEESLLEEFKRNYGTDLVLYVEEEPGVNRPRVFASTLDKGLLSPELFSRCFASGEVLFHTGKLGGRDVAVIAGPVRDFSSKIIAVVEISFDRSPTLALLKRYGAIAAVIGLIGLVVSISFVWLISVVFTKRIGEVVAGAEQIAAGHRDTRILVESGDELGVMARAINQMLTSLEASRRKLRDYAENLELMVEERTRSLKESEQTYRTLVENVPLIVYMFMPDGTTVFLNRSAAQMIGVSPQQLNGPYEVWAEHIHPDDRARVVAQRDECLGEGKDLHAEYRMVHKDGHIVYGIDHAVPVFGDDHELIRMDGIIIDVTAHKELEEKTLQSEELETLSQVSARLAHEVRNPLAAIGGLTRRLLKSFETSDPRTKKGELIVEQVEKLEKILKMMLAYIESQPIRLRPWDLNRVVTKAVERIKTQFQNRDFSVKSYLDESLHKMKLDRDLFEKVLVSLMENAFYRMGQKGEIKVATRGNGGYATVTLAYRVPFISDDDIEHFFYPFAVAYPLAGGGPDRDIMDVPICKVVIHKHGGVINVSKEDDNLVKINISLPLE
ncbi:MAG: cache domain-containing protein [Deltaproteobacteria bacterium]|nr:cache domain-containing protein [Deltaproteobacteria bacterium]